MLLLPRLLRLASFDLPPQCPTLAHISGRSKGARPFCLLHVEPRVDAEGAGGEADDADDGVDGPRSEAAALGVVDVREDRGGGDGFDSEGRGVED